MKRLKAFATLQEPGCGLNPATIINYLPWLIRVLVKYGHEVNRVQHRVFRRLWQERIFPFFALGLAPIVLHLSEMIAAKVAEAKINNAAIGCSHAMCAVVAKNIVVCLRLLNGLYVFYFLKFITLIDSNGFIFIAVITFTDQKKVRTAGIMPFYAFTLFPINGYFFTVN